MTGITASRIKQARTKKAPKGMFFLGISAQAAALWPEFGKATPAQAASLVSKKLAIRGEASREPSIELYIQEGSLGVPNIGLVFFPGDGKGARYHGHGLGDDGSGKDPISVKIEEIWHPYGHIYVKQAKIEELLVKTLDVIK